MILTGNEIIKQRERGNIVIDPFDENNVNPNSYDLTLDNKLVTYDRNMLDMRLDNPYTEIIIPESGYILVPNKLYLAKTVEYTETWLYVPMLNGKSSIGRLGINVHITAGFGDIGFCGNWTLEISVVEPVKIYPFVRFCQVCYHVVTGVIKNYNGKYHRDRKINTSQSYKDFKGEEKKEWGFQITICGATCRGSYNLGSACGRCERCEKEFKSLGIDQKEYLKQKKRRQQGSFGSTKEVQYK